jgi:tRNA (mo5U34)-methyltransferase
MPKTPDTRSLTERVRSVPIWFHSIELVPGVVTPGHKTPEILARELAALRLPHLAGKSVLDIGAFDGFFSFQAERLGAARVVALDHYAWSLELGGHMAEYHDCLRRGVAPAPYHTTRHWRPDTLPGKQGFDLAKEVLGSRVEDVVLDFMDMALSPTALVARVGGPFDVVLVLGVLYHMEHPMLALERLAALTKPGGGLAVLETEAMEIPDLPEHRMCRFLDAGEAYGDTSNWWVPNAEAVVAMCRRAGFGAARVLTPKPRQRPPGLRGWLGRWVRPRPPTPMHYRLVANAWK